MGKYEMVPNPQGPRNNWGWAGGGVGQRGDASSCGEGGVGMALQVRAPPPYIGTVSA